MLAQPSVIARLMGMEAPTTAVSAPPTPTPTPAVAAADDAVSMLKPPTKPMKPFKCTSLPHHGRINGDYYRYCLSKMKPRRSKSRRSRSHRRDHHPQEELLEKIKDEFRASWQQASMATDSEGGESTVASASGRRTGGGAADPAKWVDGRCIQRIAQENLRREKMARYGKTKVEDEDDDIHAAAAVVVTMNRAEEAEQLQPTVSTEDGSEEFFFRAPGPAANGEPEHRSASTPIRIAVLRPIGASGGSTGAGDLGEPALGLGTPPPSWKALRDGGGMEEFLRAVKERLDNEMKPNAGDGHLALVPAPTTSTRGRKGWGSHEGKGDTARRIREAAGVAKEDLGRRLSRLESFRVFRGDRGRRDAAAVKSPEHRMLKSVRARIDAMSPKKTGLGSSSSPVSSRGGRVWSSPPAYAGNVSSFSGMGSDEEEEGGQTQSCCRGDQKRAMTRLWKVHGAAATADTGVGVVPSPRALVRSFSAPATSGVPGGGAETASLSRSTSFSLLRTTVASGLRQSFSLGGKLLMTMIHLSKKNPLTTMMYSSSSNPQDSSNLITAAQTDILAGLPPPSPVSPLEVHGRSPRSFSGCTFLPESSPKWSPKCSSEFEASVSVVGGESPCRWKADAAADDPDKAYVRELLIAAGLLDDDEDAGPSEDTAAATVISGHVFDEVEDAYYYRGLRRRVYEDGAEEDEYGWSDRRRLLFHLANEALRVLQTGPSSSSPSLRRRVIESGNDVSTSRLRLRGRDLEDEVWRQVALAMAGDDATTPVTTVDSMVEGEVGRSPWMALHEDVCAVGRKVERAIFDELVGEVLRQVFVRT